MKIGEFARATELPKDTIRFYERRGLFAPRVLGNGYREYGDDHVERARAIKLAQSMGFTLREIVLMAKMWDRKTLTREARLAFLDEKAKVLETRILMMRSMCNYLRRKATWIRDGEQGPAPALRKPRKR